jgi:Tfp pilus assembly protein PilV
MSRKEVSSSPTRKTRFAVDFFQCTPFPVITSAACAAEVTPMGSCRVVSKLRAVLSSVGREGGFTLIESVMATVLLMVVGTSLSGVLASSVTTYSASRERTLAQQLVQDQIESIRRMPFSSVGLPNGNPSGTLSPTRAISVVGLHGTMTLQIAYVDDQTPNSFRTYANYKKIVVSLTRAQDSKLLTREVTYLSAAARNAATESSVAAIVQDYGTGGAVPGATVNLGTGPSAPRSDVTDASGKAIFPALTANPVSGSQMYYDLTVTPPFGYAMLKDDLPPSGVAHTQLGVAQPWSTNLRVYKPSSINVSVPSPPTVNVPPVTSVPYTLSVGSTRGSEAFAKAAGTTFTGPITSVAGEPTVPMPQYTVGASAVYGSGASAKYWFATGSSMVVPADYANNNMTQNFTLPTLGTSNWYTPAQVSALTIKVQTATGVLVGGARVAISGGPLTAPGVYIAGTTGTSGTSTGLFTVMVPSGSGYTLTAWGPATSAQLTAQSITSTVTKTITVS